MLYVVWTKQLSRTNSDESGSRRLTGETSEWHLYFNGFIISSEASSSSYFGNPKILRVAAACQWWMALKVQRI